MARNKKFNLFTEEEIPHYLTRVAANCCLTESEDSPCLDEECYTKHYNLWKYCPKQTGFDMQSILKRRIK